MTPTPIHFLIPLLWWGGAIFIAIMAKNRWRSWVGWLLIALVISPLIAGVVLFILPRKDRFDAMFKDVPYRINHGRVEALIQGRVVRFNNMDQFRNSAG